MRTIVDYLESIVIEEKFDSRARERVSKMETK